MSVLYDAGALIAAERSDRELWADHRVRLEAGLLPLVPAAVVAQVSRSPQQVQLRRLLRGCEVLPLGEEQAHAAGVLLARAKTTDVIDAVVAHEAATRRAEVVTSDRRDIQRLLDVAGSDVAIRVV